MNNLLKLSCCAALLWLSQSSLAQNQNFNLQQRSTMDFVGQTLANVCGYWQDGREYALLGGSGGMIIVDITAPSSPQQIVQIPGPNNLWKEIKVYQHYAYVTSEGGGGLQIVDLSALPSAQLAYKNYTGDGAIAGQLSAIHALHIDVKKGFVYLYGGNLLQGGAKILDLNPDPFNPKYVGSFTELGYIHDGYADNDTLYACHINEGIMSVVDMADKTNPVVLGTVETPGKFTHNAWITDDRRHVLTTDEKTPSFLTSYDVSDPSNIFELDRISPDNGNQSYVHNTHILNDWAITSWYTRGFNIVDAHRPQNLIIVAQFDTYAGSLLEFEGCWGVFPYFPSGTIIASDIEPGQMTVLTPTYQRACYFEGKVINGCTGQPYAGATVKINGGTDPVKLATTKADGIFRTGQVTPGNFTATVSAPGFPQKTVNITLVAGQVTEMDIVLDAGAVFASTGMVIDAITNAPVANANVTLSSASNTYTVTTNANGQFSQDCMPTGNYTATAGKWGYLANSVPVNAAGATVIQLMPGYYDDFALDLGWTTASTATSGDWVLGEPIGTYAQGGTVMVNPEEDASQDNNDACYMTGNGGGAASDDDIDNGTVTLTSPPMKLANYQDAVLSFYYWFYNAAVNSNPPNDKIQVKVLTGNQTVTLLTDAVSMSTWRYSGEIHLSQYVTLTDNVRVQFICADDDPGHRVEAAVDIFKVVPGTVSVQPELDNTASLLVSPNPSCTEFNIQYSWENAVENPVLEVYNLLGQTVFSQILTSKTGMATFGHNWKPGVYFAKLRTSANTSNAIKLLKQ